METGSFSTIEWRIAGSLASLLSPVRLHPPFHQPIAVSKTGDPTGAYWAYDFITPGNDFPDYGKIGAWPDGYYFTDRQFTARLLTYNGFGCFAFDRAKMLVGDSTASFIYFNAGPTAEQCLLGHDPVGL